MLSSFRYLLSSPASQSHSACTDTLPRTQCSSPALPLTTACSLPLNTSGCLQIHRRKPRLQTVLPRPLPRPDVVLGLQVRDPLDAADQLGRLFTRADREPRQRGCEQRGAVLFNRQNRVRRRQDRNRGRGRRRYITPPPHPTLRILTHRKSGTQTPPPRPLRPSTSSSKHQSPPPPSATMLPSSGSSSVSGRNHSCWAWPRS